LASIGGVRDAEIESVRRQLRLSRGAAMMYSGIDSTQSVYLLERDTDEVFYASNSELISGRTTDYEVLHVPFTETPAARWFLPPTQSGGVFLSNEGLSTHKWLHASVSMYSPAG